jgi:hypothetical protein
MLSQINPRIAVSARGFRSGHVTCHRAMAADIERRPVVASSTPTHEDVARLAYQFWEERGAPIGSPEVDWARAERELSGKRSPTDAPDARSANARAGSRRPAQHNI